MNKREKVLGLALFVILLVMAHVFIGVKIKKMRGEQDTELATLNTTLESYALMKSSSAMIKDEVNWVNKHTPPLASFEDAQTRLDQILKDSSRSLGFSTYNPKYLNKESLYVSGARFQKVKIKVSARATEKQIYQWLVKVHQPQKMRILTYLKLTPSVNHSDLIECQIIAEQFIDPK